MNDPTFGRLERVDPRDIWADEAKDFTPWLARPENLDLLADALGLGLEPVAEEENVGPFRADILCREVRSGDPVLIENQLERSDHTHLGQLLTYAVGLKAVTVIWIAKSFTDEHRAVLDWLNRITNEKFRFFGVELRPLRIEESPPAVEFNIVSQPNDWSREAARAAGGASLTKNQEKYRVYWTALHEKLNEVRGPVLGNRKPQPASWMDYRIGHTAFRVQAAITPKENRIRTEIYIAGRDAKAYFKLLKGQSAEIEREAGFKLEWLEHPKKQGCTIVHSHDDVNPFDEEDWPRQHKWLADRLNTMHDVFFQRIKDLHLGDLQNDEDEDE